MARRLIASLLSFVLVATQTMAQVSAQTFEFQSVELQSDSAAIQLAQVDARIEPLGSEAPRNWPADIDIDPPVIDHEALETGVPGQEQQFTANVIDDRGLKHVLLFYRDSPGIQYQSTTMEQIDQTSNYSVTVPTALGQKKIEYYIEALDTGGNRVLKGFPFFPLVRQLASATPISAEEPMAAAPQSKLVYVLIGAAVVGLALALSGDDDSEPPGGGGVDTVPLTINVTPPE